jgi:hypothetical protein
MEAKSGLWLMSRGSWASEGAEFEAALGLLLSRTSHKFWTLHTIIALARTDIHNSQSRTIDILAGLGHIISI